MIERDEMERQELTAVTALNLSAYLRSAGWNFERRRGRYADIFVTQDEERQRTVTVPVFEYLDDHPDRISDAISVIAQVERRSRLAVFNDLAKADHDAVRIASTNGIGHGPLTIGKSADLLRGAHDLMSNSARAAEAAANDGYQATFRGPFSLQVASYIDNVSFIHDPAHGYRLTMYSPVSIQFNANQSLGGDFLATPFARKATRTLVSALNATSNALSESARFDSTEPFRKTIQSGVSANFCDTLARLAKGGKGVAVSIKWSLLSDSDISPVTVVITHQQADILQLAAHTLRQTEPSYDERIDCHVVKLEREPHEFDGRATLLVLRGGRNVRISTTFKPENYQTVIEAFHNQTALSLIGDIYPGTCGLELRNLRNLEMLSY